MRRSLAVFALLSAILLSAYGGCEQGRDNKNRRIGPTPLFLQTGIIADARSMDWTGAGVTGGIPSAGWAKCGSTIAPYGTSGSPGSPSTINTQIAGCGANTYVLLGNGTFWLSAGIVMKSNVELRGGGPMQTIIEFTGRDSCLGFQATVCFLGGGIFIGSSSIVVGGTNSATWTGTNATTGTYTQGATSIRLTNIGSALNNNDYIYLDQTNDPAVANGFLVCTDNTITPPCSLETGAPGRCASGTWVGGPPHCTGGDVNLRNQVQIVKIVSGCSPACNGAGPYDITIEAPGVSGLNWRTSQNPGAWFGSTGSQLVNSGIQGMTIDATNATGGSQDGGITFQNASQCWVYNVRSIKEVRNHVWFLQASHITVLSNYFYDSKNASSQSYGVESFISTANLVANNIGQHINAMFMTGNAIGSVFADNFSIDDYIAQGTAPITQTSMSGCPGACLATYTYGTYTSVNGSLVTGIPVSIRGLTNGGGEFNGDNMTITNLTGTTFQVAFTTGTNVGAAAESGTCASSPGSGCAYFSNGTVYSAMWFHDAGVNYNLFEGNIGTILIGDNFHGTGNANTLFRNWYSGYEKGKNTSSVYGVNFLSYQRYNNVLGNILGNSTYNTVYENYTGCGSCTGQPVIQLGFGATETVTTSPDTQVRTTLYRFGNYDTKTNAVRWCGNSGNTGWSTTCASTSEVPTGLVDGYAQTVPAAQTFPASFAFASKPSWYASAYATVHWPGIGPDVTGGAAIAPDMLGTTTAPGGFVYANPAELCYMNASIDSANYPLAFDRGMLAFDANTCYTAGGGGGGPSPPGGSQIQITAVPIPAPPAQPAIASVSPARTYVTTQGCSQDGVVFANPCIFSISCSSGCSSTTTLTFDGTTVTQTYASGIMRATVPLSILPVPTSPTAHTFLATNPGAIPPPLRRKTSVVKKRSLRS